jgi:pimeloyl-ACP methyl ester carboxylesterase
VTNPDDRWPRTGFVHDLDMRQAGAAGGRLVGLAAAAGSTSEPAAVVLLLHGGRAHSYDPVSWGNLAVARMDALARGIRRERTLPVLALRYRVRGWNDEGGARIPDPVRDAWLALEAVESGLGPVPVILVGHSLGGRTAVRVAEYPTVRAVAALAPWLPPDEPVDTLVDRTLLVAHGRRDRVTNVGDSIAFATRAGAVADAVYLKVLDDGHAMLRRPGEWRRLVVRFAALAAFGSSAGALDAERVGGE